MSNVNKDILQEIENDSATLLEALTLYSEEEGIKQPAIDEKPSIDGDKSTLKKKLINKGNAVINHMQKKISDEDYIVNGYSYHSKLLYKMSVKYPFLSKTIGVPLMAITKAVTNNAIHRKMEQEKILKVYTTFKGDKAAVDAKVERLEKLQKPNREQKEEILMLKKMSAELEFSIKRLEFNYKMSHEEASRNNDDGISKKRKYYTS